MIEHGKPPFLECSSVGDRRFSARYARLRGNARTIKEIYQAAKQFPTGSGRSIKSAKGRRALNMPEVTRLYERLWRQYIRENPQLLLVLKHASGLSDRFVAECNGQTTVSWKICNKG